MTPSHSDMHRVSNVPDPEYLADLYEDVPSKRLFAWFIDVVLIAVIVGVLTLFSFFTALFFLPFLFAVVSFLYRWGTLAARSATPGMRFMSIGLRDAHGDYLNGATAFLHTLGYFISVVTFPLQLISIAMMLTTKRKQGLTDMIIGTVALNKQVA